MPGPVAALIAREAAAAAQARPFVSGGTGPEIPSLMAADQIWKDVYPVPYRGPTDVNNRYTGETSVMRLAYRQLYFQEPSVRSAIDGKAASVAGLDVAVIPEDKDDPEDRRAADFVKWSVERSFHGWDGLIRNTLLPAFVDGWSVGDIKLRVADPRLTKRWPNLWTLDHVGGIDTANLRLQLDQFRNVRGVVNTIRGLEDYDPDKVVLFTHNDLFSDPFGTSDIRAAFRNANIIEDAWYLWNVALRVYGGPFLHGSVPQDSPVRFQQMQAMLRDARAAGWCVTAAEDSVEVINLASATSFEQFQQAIEKCREEIFLAIRGAYLPYMQGSGGGTGDHGNTGVSKHAGSDPLEYLLAKAVGRCLTRQLVPHLVRHNFPLAGMPQVVLGGVNWAETKTQIEVATQIKDIVPISAKWLYEVSQVPPPSDPDDSVGGPPQPPGTPPDAGGMPLGPEAMPAPTAPAEPAPVGEQFAAPAITAAAPAGLFPANLANRYSDYFLPTRHGDYPGDMHDQFGLSVPDFARSSGLLRKAVKSGWAWATRPGATPDASGGVPVAAVFSAGFSANTGENGATTFAAGDDFDQRFAAFAAMFSDGEYPENSHEMFGMDVQTFADRSHLVPVKREYNGVMRTVYINPNKDKQTAERKERSDKFKADNEGRTPKEQLQHLRAQAEPKRAAAREALARVQADPSKVTHADLPALTDHLMTLTRDELREHARAVSEKTGGLKRDVAERLVARVRAAVPHLQISDLDQIPGLGESKGVRPTAAKPAPLSPDEIKAIRDFTDSNLDNGPGLYQKVNTLLRGGDIADPLENFERRPMTPEEKAEAEKAHAAIQGAFRHAETRTGATVYRGIGLPKQDVDEFLSRMTDAANSGQPVTFPGYQSTTPDLATAQSFVGGLDPSHDAGVTFSIKDPTGLDISPYSIANETAAGEKEFLLNHDSRFRVTGVKPAKSKYGLPTVELEQIAPEPKAARPKATPEQADALALSGFEPNRHDVKDASGNVVPQGSGYSRYDERAGRVVGYTHDEALELAGREGKGGADATLRRAEQRAADPSLSDFDRDIATQQLDDLRERYDRVHGAKPDPALDMGTEAMDAGKTGAPTTRRADNVDPAKRRADAALPEIRAGSGRPEDTRFTGVAANGVEYRDGVPVKKQEDEPAAFEALSPELLDIDRRWVDAGKWQDFASAIGPAATRRVVAALEPLVHAEIDRDTGPDNEPWTPAEAAANSRDAKADLKERARAAAEHFAGDKAKDLADVYYSRELMGAIHKEVRTRPDKAARLKTAVDAIRGAIATRDFDRDIAEQQLDDPAKRRSDAALPVREPDPARPEDTRFTGVEYRDGVPQKRAEQSPENQSRPVDKVASDSKIPASAQPGMSPGAGAGVKPVSNVKPTSLPNLTAASDKQRAYAESVRNKFVNGVHDDGTPVHPTHRAVDSLIANATPDAIAGMTHAKDWLDNKDKIGETLLAKQFNIPTEIASKLESEISHTLGMAASDAEYAADGLRIRASKFPTRILSPIGGPERLAEIARALGVSVKGSHF